MEIWEQFIDDARRELPGILSGLNGVPSNEKRTICARYTPEVEMGAQHQGINIAKEMVSALNQEMRAETIQNLLDRARLSAPVSGTFQPGGPSTFTDLVLKIHQTSALLHSDSMIIVSPTMLTVIQSDETGIFKRIPDEDRLSSSKTGGLTKVGMLERFPVFCDAYGHDDAPVLIAAPAWFSYSAGDTLSAKQTTDLVTNDTVISFDTDVQLEINSQRVRQLKVDPMSLRFFN